MAHDSPMVKTDYDNHQKRSQWGLKITIRIRLLLRWDVKEVASMSWLLDDTRTAPEEPCNNEQAKPSNS